MIVKEEICDKLNGLCSSKYKVKKEDYLNRKSWKRKRNSWKRKRYDTVGIYWRKGKVDWRCLNLFHLFPRIRNGIRPFSWIRKSKYLCNYSNKFPCSTNLIKTIKVNVTGWPQIQQKTLKLIAKFEELGGRVRLFVFVHKYGKGNKWKYLDDAVSRKIFQSHQKSYR